MGVKPRGAEQGAAGDPSHGSTSWVSRAMSRVGSAETGRQTGTGWSPGRPRLHRHHRRDISPIARSGNFLGEFSRDTRRRRGMVDLTSDGPTGSGGGVPKMKMLQSKSAH